MLQRAVGVSITAINCTYYILSFSPPLPSSPPFPSLLLWSPRSFGDFVPKPIYQKVQGIVAPPKRKLFAPWFSLVARISSDMSLYFRLFLLLWRGRHEWVRPTSPLHLISSNARSSLTFAHTKERKARELKQLQEPENKEIIEEVIAEEEVTKQDSDEANDDTCIEMDIVSGTQQEVQPEPLPKETARERYVSHPSCCGHVLCSPHLICLLFYCRVY